LTVILPPLFAETSSANFLAPMSCGLPLLPAVESRKVRSWMSAAWPASGGSSQGGRHGDARQELRAACREQHF
jgi:hypothetical protein